MWAALRAAVEAGAQAAQQVGELVGSQHHSRPAEGLGRSIHAINFNSRKERKVMKILVANLGSTSFKYRLFDMTDERQLARGGIERIGSAESPCFAEIAGEKRQELKTRVLITPWRFANVWNNSLIPRTVA